MVDMLRITICSLAIVTALALSMALSQRMSKLLLCISAAVAIVGGFLIYGYSYSVLYDSIAIASVKTIIAVIHSFAGSDSLSDIIDVPIFRHIVFQIAFWVIQLLSIFSTTGAALITFGYNLLQNLRLRIGQRKDLYIIYHLNGNTLDFAKDVLSRIDVTVVFVDAQPSADLVLAAKRAGAAVKTGTDAVDGSTRFLKSVGMFKTKRKLHVFALDPETASDQTFARKLLGSLKLLGISAGQTSLTIMGDEDKTDSQLYYAGSNYGYGNVYSVNKPYLTARLLQLMAPAYKTVSFDSVGRATADFRGVLIGCDRVGQAVLRQLVMNAQFEGSSFHLAVFSPNVEEVIGRMYYEDAQMLREFDIQFFSHDGRSRTLYEYVAKHIDDLNYIVLCTGNKSRNMEIAQQLQPFLRRKGCDLPVYQCDHDGVRYLGGEDTVVESSIYTAQVLCSDAIDELAIALNQTYCGSGDARENWAKCDYFSRMSSRASADFMPAMLHASGQTADAWNPEGELLENLAKTEHKRWCAFHYAMGFSTMSAEEWYRRANIYKQEVKETGKGKMRLGKDLRRRVHACLIDWDALDELSQREFEVTGKPVDYKQLDRNNVLTMAELLKS